MLIIDIRLAGVAKFVIIFGTRQSWHVYNTVLCETYMLFSTVMTNLLPMLYLLSVWQERLALYINDSYSRVTYTINGSDGFQETTKNFTYDIKTNICA